MDFELLIVVNNLCMMVQYLLKPDLFAAYLLLLKLILHESIKFSTLNLMFPYFFVTKKMLSLYEKRKYESETH